METLRNLNPGKTSAFNQYIADKVTSGTGFKEVSALWKKESTKTKEKYEELAEQANLEKEKYVKLWEVAHGVKPKRPVGAQALYLQQLSREGKLENNRNVLSDVSARWAKLSDEEKLVFERLHKKNQLEYAVALAEHKRFMKEHSVTASAPSALNLYFKDKAHLFKNEDLKAGQLFAKIHAKWKKESKTVQDKYEKQAEEGKSAAQEAKRTQDASRVQPTRNLNAYTIYFKTHTDAMRKKNPNLSQPEIMSRIAAEWKKLGA